MVGLQIIGSPDDNRALGAGQAGVRELRTRGRLQPEVRVRI